MNSNPIHVKLNNLGKWSLGSAHYTFIHIQMIFHMSNVVNISKSQIDQGRCLNFLRVLLFRAKKIINASRSLITATI